MIRKVVIGIVLAAALVGPASAQFAEASHNVAPSPELTVQAVPGVTPIGSPVIVRPADDNTIAIGQIFGQLLAPYVTAAVEALVGTAFGWIFWLLKTKLNINIDAEHRASITAAAQRQAASLVADGAVSVRGKTITVNNEALAAAVSAASNAAGDAVKHFGITPQSLADRIVDMIPQVPAAAPVVSAAIAAAPAEIPAPAAPAAAKV
jgi:hypothetical protein